MPFIFDYIFAYGSKIYVTLPTLMIDQDYKKVGFFMMESHSKDQAMCDRTLLVHKKVLTCKNKVFIFYTFFLLDLDQIKTKNKTKRNAPAR